MSRFRERIIAFMYGRNGVDALYNALMVACFALLMVNIFARLWVITLLTTAILVYAMFRALSRNTYRRAQENAAWLRVWNPIKAWFRLCVTRIKDLKIRRYRRCPQCKATLRLPIRRGKHAVSCPRCGRDFTVHIIL